MHTRRDDNTSDPIIKPLAVEMPIAGNGCPRPGYNPLMSDSGHVMYACMRPD